MNNPKARNTMRENNGRNFPIERTDCNQNRKANLRQYNLIAK